MALDLLREAKRHFIQELESRLEDCRLLDGLVVSSLPSPEEALGDPGRDDFCLTRSLRRRV